MNASLLFTIMAIVEAAFGIGLLVWPTQMMELFGLAPSTGGLVLARLFGAAIFSLAVLFWLCRNIHDRAVVQIGLTVGFVYNLLALVLLFRAVTGGLLASSAWGTVVLHLLLTLGCGYLRRTRA